MWFRKLKLGTQVQQPCVVDDCAAHVYFLYGSVFVLHEVPAELASVVSAEPVGLAGVPERTERKTVTWKLDVNTLAQPGDGNNINAVHK